LISGAFTSFAFLAIELSSISNMLCYNCKGYALFSYYYHNNIQNRICKEFFYFFPQYQSLGVKFLI
jgi:hypothetical protein